MGLGLVRVRVSNEGLVLRVGLVTRVGFGLGLGPLPNLI